MRVNFSRTECPQVRQAATARGSVSHPFLHEQKHDSPEALDPTKMLRVASLVQHLRGNGGHNSNHLNIQVKFLANILVVSSWRSVKFRSSQVNWH